MELESLKTHLVAVQSLYVDEDSSADDIVYATFDFVRAAHIVAKLLLLEGRYAELQRCLHLCQSAFYPPHCDTRSGSPANSSVPTSWSARYKRDGSAVPGSAASCSLLERTPTSAVNPGLAVDAVAAQGSPTAGLARSRESLTGGSGSRDFPALQLEFWSFLNDEDISLFRALYQRTQRLQKALDEARRTRKGRDTAYYVHKLVESRPDYPVEGRFAHTITSSCTRTPSPLLPSLRSQASGTTSRPRPFSRTCVGIDGDTPPPPERGVSLGNRTKLNRWKVGQSLQPFVTSRRMFLDDHGDDNDADGEEDGAQLFARDHRAPQEPSDCGLASSSSSPNTTTTTAPAAVVTTWPRPSGASRAAALPYVPCAPSDLALLFSSDSLASSLLEHRRQCASHPPNNIHNHSSRSHDDDTTSLLSSRPAGRLAPLSAITVTSTANTAPVAEGAPLGPTTDAAPALLSAPAARDLLLTGARLDANPDHLMNALEAHMAPSWTRAATVSAAVEAALAPHRPPHTAPVEPPEQSRHSPVLRPVSKVPVHVGGVASRELSSAKATSSSRAWLASVSQTAAEDSDDDGAELDAQTTASTTPTMNLGSCGGLAVAEAAPELSGTVVEVVAADTDAVDAAAAEHEHAAEEKLILVTADCPADRKRQALHACAYQYHPQITAVIDAHLQREKAEENVVYDRLLNADRKAALHPPCLSTTAFDATGFMHEDGPAGGAATPRRGSAEVGSTTVSYLRTHGPARMFESTTATRSQMVFQELRTADREIRRRSRVLGASVNSDDAVGDGGSGVFKRVSTSAVNARAPGEDADGAGAGDGPTTRSSIVLPNVFFVEVEDDGEADDWEASINVSRAGRTASTVSELKSTLTMAQPSFRYKRTLSGVGNHFLTAASAPGFGRAPSRKGSMFSFRGPGSPNVTGGPAGRGRARKDSVVFFAHQQQAGSFRSARASHNPLLPSRTLDASVLAPDQLRDICDWTSVNPTVLQSNLMLCVWVVRIQRVWRGFAARRLVHRLGRRVRRHREDEIRQDRAVRLLQRLWRERQSRQVLRHRRALRDYVEERRVMEEVALYPSAGLDVAVDDLPTGQDPALHRGSSFYTNRLMRYASYASLSNVSDHGDDNDGGGSGAVAQDSDGFLMAVATTTSSSTAGAPRAAGAGRPRGGSAVRRRSARSSFHMVPPVKSPLGSRRGSFADSRGLHQLRPSQAASPTGSQAGAVTFTAAQTYRSKPTLPPYGVPPTLSTARSIALRHLQRHVAARAIVRFLRASINRAERRMQREVFGLVHYLTRQWSREETATFFSDDGAMDGDDNAQRDDEEDADDVVVGQDAGMRSATSFLVDTRTDDSGPITFMAHRPLQSPNTIGASLMTVLSDEVTTARQPSASRTTATSRSKGSGRHINPTKPTFPKPASVAQAGGSADAGVSALIQRTSGDVYEQFVARSIAARENGHRLTVLERVSLKALEAEAQQRQAEAARLEEERQQQLFREAEERRAREARKLEAITLLQRVGRAARRRHWLRARHQEAEDRRNLQYRSQLFTAGFAEASMRSLEGSVNLLADGIAGVHGAETEEVLPTRSTVYIHHMLATRHPGWYSHDTRRKQAAQTTSVVLTLQCFLRAHISTDVAFRLFLHKQATVLQSAWRGHKCRTKTGAIKAQVAKRVEDAARHESIATDDDFGKSVPR